MTISGLFAAIDQFELLVVQYRTQSNRASPVSVSVRTTWGMCSELRGRYRSVSGGSYTPCRVFSSIRSLLELDKLRQYDQWFSTCFWQMRHLSSSEILRTALS